MARGWYGLEIGDEVVYQGTQGKIIELFVRDKNGGLMQTADGREYLVVCELCKKVEKDPVDLCPKCLLEGKKAEVVKNAILERCVRCMTDFKYTPKEGAKVEQPIRGMKALLG